ncbi:MAG: response regulator [Candidatus Buchananbacteria bacterium CG10_big_fil_rev_8_21_14_0_10_42_9]|uniref:Response regulator n=1 Tax=Candidatus Buchananbacteria bacterium CG10_big_fil_rev_8_21_14_0_10_42_9 TaxID=1974526 RepID=A0A2H0W0T0_9BACT|nr:MAG: response regulator [Candidatus Buchananbacteria bacterium CG10_big_fil_rev_8_21_14_0_10_42_9]
MAKSKSQLILLVEDDEFLAELYATKLELEGYEVALAKDGASALKLVSEKTINLVLLDIILPKMDGFEVLSKLKSNSKTKNIPVILLTNLSQKDEVKKGFDLGADDYLIKAHFMPSEVITKIKNILDKK